MGKQPKLYFVLCFIFCTVSCKDQGTTVQTKVPAPLESTKVNATAGPSSITRNIIQDSEGNVWLASWEGVFKYGGTSFENITKDVSSSRFFSILEDSSGNFWFGSIGSGVYYYDGTSFQNFTTEDGLVDNRVTYIYEDRKGNIWFGTLGGASCYDGKSFKNFTTKDGLSHNEVNTVLEDSTGIFWFGTSGEACFYDGKSFTTVVYNDRETFSNVRHIIQDHKGAVWLGGSEGLWRYDEGLFAKIADNFVGFSYEDKGHTIWMSAKSATSQDWVLSRCDISSLTREKPNVKQILTEPGMLFGIVEDDKGTIWCGTLNGVNRYDKNTLRFLTPLEH
jgi:ligand-binding sensor domain-containing protein